MLSWSSSLSSRSSQPLLLLLLLLLLLRSAIPEPRNSKVCQADHPRQMSCEQGMFQSRSRPGLQRSSSNPLKQAMAATNRRGPKCVSECVCVCEIVSLRSLYLSLCVCVCRSESETVGMTESLQRKQVLVIYLTLTCTGTQVYGA